MSRLQTIKFIKASAGYTPTDEYLSLLPSYGREEDENVWADISRNVDSVRTLLREDDDDLDLFNRFTVNVMSEAAGKADWNRKDENG